MPDPVPPPERVPESLRTAAGWAWRILVLLALVAMLVFLIVQLQIIVVALFVALLVTALLRPAALRLRSVGLPHGLSTAAVMGSALTAVALLLYLVGRAIARQAGAFADTVADGVEALREWVDTTFGISFDELMKQLEGHLSSGSGGTGGGLGELVSDLVFGAASTALEVVSGAGIALFATIFFVHDGGRIWRWIVSLFPRGVQPQAREAGILAWETLSGYARGTLMIAAIDGLGIGLGAALIGVPLAGPITALAFFGSFIPILGAFVSGGVACLIALATLGFGGALLMGVIVILVQQIEGHVLTPLIQGRMVSLHPLAVVLAVAGGSVLAGLVGAIVAVPVVSVLNVLLRYAAQFLRTPDDPPMAIAEHAGDGAPGEAAADGLA